MSVQGNGGFPQAKVRLGMLFLMPSVWELHSPASKASSMPHEGGNDANGITGWVGMQEP